MSELAKLAEKLGVEFTPHGDFPNDGKGNMVITKHSTKDQYLAFKRYCLDRLNEFRSDPERQMQIASTGMEIAAVSEMSQEDWDMYKAVILLKINLTKK